MEESKKIVCASGYFNPLHRGHISYLNEAKKLGDYLIVIVNNDFQIGLKGSKRFMDEKERCIIVNNLKCVDEVRLSVDMDETVCKSLELIKPNIFAKGGDSTIDNIPERKICEKIGIKMVFNVGEDKIQSSSNLLANQNDLTICVELL